MNRVYYSNPPLRLEEINIVNEQMKKCVCKITNRNMIGTGFFMKIKIHNNKLLPVLVTNNHILSKENIKKGEKIIISINNEEKYFIIDIDDSRITFSDELFDTTFIQIKEKQDQFFNIINYLELDERIYSEKRLSENECIYILNYLKGGDIVFSPGSLKHIKDNEIKYNCITNKGSSGSPILSLDNCKVIGIHYKGCKKGNIEINKGILIKYPIKEFQNYINDTIIENMSESSENSEKLNENNKYKGIYLHECEDNKVGEFINKIFLQKIGKLPIAQNILFSSKETSIEEIQTFLYRAILCDYNTLFVVEINDSLSDYQQSKMYNYIDTFLTYKNGQYKEKEKQNVDKDKTSKYLDSCIVFVYEKKNKDNISFLNEIRKLEKQEFENEYDYTEDIKDEQSNSLKKITVVTSDVCGLGKSFKIKKMIKNNNQNYFYFRLGGKLTKKVISNKLSKLLNKINNENTNNVKNNKEDSSQKPKNAIHLDLTESEKTTIINEFLFSFLITNCYICNEKIIYIPKDIEIFIEISNYFENYLSKFGVLNIFPNEHISLSQIPKLDLSTNIINFFDYKLLFSIYNKRESIINIFNLFEFLHTRLISIEKEKKSFEEVIYYNLLKKFLCECFEKPKVVLDFLNDIIDISPILYLFYEEKLLRIYFLAEILIYKNYNNQKLSENIRLIGTCNPYKRKKYGPERCGLRRENDNDNDLVYMVQFLPFSLLYYDYFFDWFNEEEDIYRYCIRECLFTKDEKTLDETIIDIIFVCLKYLIVKYDPSVVSVREISRFLKIVELILKYYLIKSEYEENINKGKRENDKNLKIGNKLIKTISKLICFLYLYYYFRLTLIKLVDLLVTDKEMDNNNNDANENNELIYNNNKDTIISQINNKDLKRYMIQQNIRYLSDFIKIEEDYILDKIELYKGIDKNDLLKENIFLLLASVITKIPLIIVSKPGTKKSLSAYLIYKSMIGKYSKEKFFRKFPLIIQNYFQGPEPTKPEEIGKLFEISEKKLKSCTSQKELKNEELPISMILFDDLGLAEKSEISPLKLLNSKLEYAGKVLNIKLILNMKVLFIVV